MDRAVGLCQRRHSVGRGLLAGAGRVDRLASDLQHLADHRLQERLEQYRQTFRRGHAAAIAPVLHPALAAIREAADRQVGLRPFRVQLAGALALHRGYLAEMATGEGKTLTAGVAAVLAGWTKLPCHIITVNDYLAQRDAEWLRALYRFCGVSVGFVTSEMDAAARRQAYAQDVTYTTSKEVVADFLRDRLILGEWYDACRRHIRRLLNPRQSLEQLLVMRGLHTAVVDEADSVLIDEAVTPLIICRQQENQPLQEACRRAHEIAAALSSAGDYRTNLKYKEVEIRPAGEKRIEGLSADLPGIWKGPRRRLELVRQALVAREFFHRDMQYVLQDGKVIIVDEFTGRLMPGRTWREGLHQAIEAKEGLAPTPPSETMARVSFQRFFRLYHRLSGMTGTAAEAAMEFWQIYRLPVIRIPTNRPCQRLVLPDRVFASPEAKWNAVVERVVELHQLHVPVLVGTRSISASELLAERLRARELPFQLLNAVHHREEARIVAEAGLPGRITIATNMAGRGTDIRLAQGVAELGGLYVVATERHESGRIDRQLFGRCARQGDPGTAQAFVSMDDELLRRFVPKALRRAVALGLTPGGRDSTLLAGSLVGRAQRQAQRLAFHQRRQVLTTDTWLDEALAYAGSRPYT